MSTERLWNDTDRMKLKYWESDLPQCQFFFFTRNFTWTGLGSKKGPHGKRVATNRLSP
jgi:hypothetical protein